MMKQYITVWTLIGMLLCVSCGGDSSNDVSTQPECEIDVTNLDFGEVSIASYKEATFTISNGGGGTLSGMIYEACDRFTIPSGSGAFSLAGGESRTVTVRFAPETEDVYICTVHTGSGCSDIECGGEGVQSQCSLDQPNLEFGMVVLGEYQEIVFDIENIGSGTLDGVIEEMCDDFSITSGGGAYSIGPGQSISATVRFSPSTLGGSDCSIYLGGLCSSIECTGSGVESACYVYPDSIDFGNVLTGASADSAFYIENAGGETLTGDVSADCGSIFSIQSGGGPFSLEASETHAVTVRFSAPGIPGNHSCEVDLGTHCSPLRVKGAGLAGDCELSIDPAIVTFGWVDVGNHRDREFTIYNRGNVDFPIVVEEDCMYYFILSGGGSFLLEAQQAHMVVVRYAPEAEGSHTCFVQIGDYCEEVRCIGVAQ